MWHIVAIKQSMARIKSLPNSGHYVLLFRFKGSRMKQQVDFFCKQALGSNTQLLASTAYNDMRVLTKHDIDHCQVPIRRLGYLAVINSAEVLFVDIHFRRVVEFSWQSFQPQSRLSLNSPVAYEYTWFNKRAHNVMQRMPLEFAKVMAKKAQSIRDHHLPSAQLLSFPA
jgi:hypothetical protein